MSNALVPAPYFAPKPKNPPTPKKDNPAKDAICHQCGEGLRGSRKLKPGALSLYVCDGHRAAVEAIGEFHLCLPSGLDDIYEIDLSSSNTNDSSMYAISNKRAKLNLDSTLLWPCRLGHISKKCIEKLKHDGLLDSTDIKSFKKSTRTRRPTDQLCLHVDAEEHELGDLGEPANYKSTLLDPESKKWLNAMNVEMQSMRDNEVWELVDLRPNDKTVGHKWLFKKKTDMDGAVHTYKACLVAKGFTQTPGIDYEETFSPVVDIRAIRILIAISTFYDYEIWKMNVKTAFLNGYLKEEKFGLSRNHDDPCVYLNASGSYVTFLILYVDDILIMGNNIPMLQDVKSYLGRCFAMKDLGEAAYILGIKIYKDRSKWLIGLCQSAYIEKILKRYFMENSKRRTIPMQEKLKLSKSQGASTPAEKQRMQNIPYASVVGSIMVSCYTDAGYLTNADDLKSQTGYEFVLNGGAIDWKSTKLGVVPTIEEPINMYCGNTGAIAIAKDRGVTKGARHFRAKVHYLRETIEMGDVRIEKVDTDDNLADPFTKALAFSKHSELTKKIGMIPASSLM
ncbi:retrotransposon protein, putative, ty1-copia subclass [Tanacetum coccineum]